MTSKRRTFTKQFKREAVELVKAVDRPGREIDRDLDLPRGILYRWRWELASADEQAFPGHVSLKPADEVVSLILAQRVHSSRSVS